MTSTEPQTTTAPNFHRQFWPGVVLALIGLAGIGIGLYLLTCAGQIVGSPLLPMQRYDLSDAQTLYVLLLYVCTLASFAAGAVVTLIAIRRLAAV